MNPLAQVFGSSIGKKFLMAVTGFILVGFVLVHMIGNLQIFLSPEAINAYAHHLHTLPAPVLWGFRAFLLLTVIVHVWVAIVLTRENRAAKRALAPTRRVQASYASRTMIMSGLILLSFIVFHILHFTVRVVPENYNETVGYVATPVGHDSIPSFDVFTMMVAGFSNPLISLFYIIGMGLLCMHLTHGVSSMFQTLGVRNEGSRYTLNKAAATYGWIIFLGFASIPAGIMVSQYTAVDLVDMEHYDAHRGVVTDKHEMAHAQEALPTEEPSH